MTLLHPKLVVMAVGAVALLWPSRAESPPASMMRPAPDAVRIEHHLIRIVPSSPPPHRRRILTAVNRLAAASPPRERPQRFAARAGRIIIGDGRYRPEPFPRPGR